MNKSWLLCCLLLPGLLLAEATHQQTHQQRTQTELLINPRFDLEISDKIKEAINNGIVITFVMQAKLFKQVDWWFDDEISSKINTYQVRYFSLSRQYQLTHRGSDEKQSFVTLEQLLEHMSLQSQFRFTAFKQATHVETRFFLDKQALPSTMQLPTVFDQDWNLNSDWQRTALSQPPGSQP
ncbi:DUF4390 domain-containing protein [Marinicella sediminis]|uniref:DUF4390 domain-containing protein n=1 Tax=Marinicella sediminis TaxID=1792834 RepID=A0ABV7JDC5_9GAMM|nr:DUF4390 domain-containing protein [Marinicella sediminis]